MIFSNFNKIQGLLSAAQNLIKKVAKKCAAGVLVGISKNRAKKRLYIAEILIDSSPANRNIIDMGSDSIDFHRFRSPCAMPFENHKIV